MAWPLPYADGTSPAATEIDDHEDISNGRLVDDLNADRNKINYLDTGGLLYVNTYAELRAIPSADRYDQQRMLMAGYYEAGDGGGGEFIYLAASAATHNGGTIIAPASGTGRWLRVYSGPVNVQWFGAIPNGSRTVTTALQAALNLTGHIQIPYSAQNYIIDDVLLISSNTWLEVHPRATIYEASGNNTQLLRNTTLSNTPADTNIRVTGGIWDNNWAGNPGVDFDSAPYTVLRSSKTSPVQGAHGTLGFYGVTGLKLQGLTVKDANLFSIQIAVCYDWEARDIDFVRTEATISDGIHVNGPSSRFVIDNIRGSTGDDFVALNSWDWTISAPDTGTGTTAGDITRGSITRLRPVLCHWGAIKMTLGTGAGVHDVVIDDVNGISSNGGFIWMKGIDGQDPGHVTGDGAISGVTLRNISVGTTLSASGGGITYGAVLQILPGIVAKDIVIDGVNMSGDYQPTGQGWLFLMAGSSIESLAVSNFRAFDTTRSYVFDIHGTVGKMSLSDSDFLGDGTFTGLKAYQTILQQGADSVIEALTITNCRFSGVYGVYSQAAESESNITFSNSFIDAFQYAFQMNGDPCSLTAANIVMSGNAGAFVAMTDAGANGSVRTANLVPHGIMLHKTAGVLTWYGTDAVVDLSVLTNLAMNTLSGNTEFQLLQNKDTVATERFASFKSREALASNPQVLVVDYTGAAALADRRMVLQTSEYGVDYGGVLSLQPNGGTLEFGAINLPVYADNAAATAGGLAVNKPYRTATGELRIVV